MALLFNPNLIPASHYDTVYQWKEFLKTAGWTVPQSGSGTGHANGASDLITSAAVMAQANAWFVIRDGDGIRSLCFQVGSADTQWRVKYSASAGFSGGSAGPGQVPSATDEVVLWGSGTDGSPGFGSLFQFGTGGSRKVQMLADSSAPWSFLLISYPSGNGPDTVFMLDGLLGPAAGDPDPVVVGVFYDAETGGLFQYNANALGNVTTNDTSPYFFSAWMGKGLAGQRFGRVTPLYYCGGSSGVCLWPANATSNSGGVGTFSGNDYLLPVMWARDTARPGPGGYKGLSRWLKFNGSNRAFGDLLSMASPGARDYAHVSNGVVIPWNGGSFI